MLEECKMDVFESHMKFDDVFLQQNLINLVDIGKNRGGSKMMKLIKEKLPASHMRTGS